ncbi:MAG: tetratricopeptide repeat protein [Terriglobales bacterium]
MKTKFAFVLAGLMLATVLATPAWSQTTIVKGRATDADGKPITRATVELTNKENGRKYNLKTNNKGEYFSLGIQGGTYTAKLVKDGQALLTINNFPVSLSQEENVLDFNVASEKAKAVSTMTQEQRQHLEQAQKEHEKIAGLNNMLAQAAEFEKAGNFDQAIAVLNQAVQTDATKDLVWARLGEANLVAGKKVQATDRAKAKEYFQESIAAFKKAVAIKPAGPYLNELGEAYARAGDTQAAVQQYTLAAQNDPAEAGRYYFNLGAVLTNSGRVDEANAAFDKAIAADPARADAYYWKAVNLLGKATVDKSGHMVAPPGVAEGLNKYLELSPNGPNAQAAKDLLASIGAKVQTSYGAKKKK